MTEEEKLAEEWVSDLADTGNFDLEKFGKAYFSESSMRHAFLAGLKAGNESKNKARDLLARWVDNRPYTVSEQKDLIADTELFLKESDK